MISWPNDWSERVAPKLLVAGDVILDEYWIGNASRISPEAPVPVVELMHKYASPGGAALVALNASSAGGKVSLLSLIGSDQHGETLIKIIAESDETIDIACIPSHNVKTPHKLRVIANGQQVVRVDQEDPKALFSNHDAHWDQWITDSNRSFDVVLLSDYNKGNLAPSRIESLKRAGKLILADPKPNQLERFHGVDLISPNLNEAESILGRSIANENLKPALADLAAILACRYVVVTLGMAGISYYDVMHEDFGVIPAVARTVYDVTGAGDVAFALLGVALGRGYSLRTAAELANQAGSWSVGIKGTAVIPAAPTDQTPV